MIYRTLVDAHTLHEQLADPQWVIVDCRFNLLDTEAGRRAYQQSHIPGARYAHLDEALSGPITAKSGRHPLPDPQHLAATLGAWGIAENTQVVAYDDMSGSIAARLWWLLGWLGHERRAVLDGGLPAWRRLGLPLSTQTPIPVPKIFRAYPDNRQWVTSDTVLQNVVNGIGCLLDARASARFRGAQEPIDPVAGHIPNALNMPLEQNLDSEGCFLNPEELRERYVTLLRDKAPQSVLHMCGSGVTACHNLLAMEIAGLAGSRLYAGSWSEWIRDPTRPIATGEV